MRPLVTCLQEKLLKIEFRFKKIDERIAIYNKTCEKADESFQSIYAEAASLVLRTNNHVFMDSLLIGIKLVSFRSGQAILAKISILTFT